MVEEEELKARLRELKFRREKEEKIEKLQMQIDREEKRQHEKTFLGQVKKGLKSITKELLK